MASISRRCLLTLAGVGVGVGALRLQAQSADFGGAARDYVYQSLELLSASSSPTEIASAARLLRLALDQEPSFGDAHYYRYLCLQRLGQDAAMQKNHLAAAQRYDSEALRDMRDPFVLAVPHIYESLPAIGQKWALVVGISQFQPKIGPERLQYAANDAEAFAALLRDPVVGRFPSSQVLLLMDADATTANIKARLNTIARRAKPEDVVLTYISTHGSSRSDDLRQVSYLFTHDTDVTSRDQIFGTALPMVEISGIISNRCVAQRTVAIFDTCHSGSSLDSKALSPDEINRLRLGAGRYIISSCAPDQKSYEDAGHGFFTASLIEQLKLKNGCIRLKELFGNVQKDVAARVLARYGKAQRPVMATSDDASEIVLGAAIGSVGDGCTAQV